MKKYTLFSEFSNKEIYGKDLADALLHCRNLRLPGKCQDNKHFPGEKLTIKKAICYEKVDNSRRGNDAYERVIVELHDNTRISIDGRPSPTGTLSSDLSGF